MAARGTGHRKHPHKGSHTKHKAFTESAVGKARRQKTHRKNAHGATVHVHPKKLQ